MGPCRDVKGTVARSGSVLQVPSFPFGTAEKSEAPKGKMIISKVNVPSGHAHPLQGRYWIGSFAEKKPEGVLWVELGLQKDISKLLSTVPVDATLLGIRVFADTTSTHEGTSDQSGPSIQF